MLLLLQVITVFLVGFAMSMALAHALEYPGKLRLDQQTYMVVQTIYYPGFTLGGIGEVLAVIATLFLAIAFHDDSVAFWWAISSFIAVLAMHAIFWFFTQPVNKYWLKDLPLPGAAEKFFATDRRASDPNWKHFRARWEYSHIARAILSAFALVAVAVAVAS